MILRRRLVSELDCATKDAVLALSFERPRLLRLLQEAGAEEDLPPSAPDDTVFALAHELCHKPCLFAGRLGRLLDRLHAETIRDVSEMDHDELHRICCGTPLGEIENLPALLWATATDPRECLRGSEQALARRIHVGGLRALASTFREGHE